MNGPLRPLWSKNLAGQEGWPVKKTWSKEWLVIGLNRGAGNRARTGDIQLGKLTLYQLSYARKSMSTGVRKYRRS